ncbi:MAG: hypothetical protein ACRDXX_07290 [Stackebrandtia sp.]
MGAYLDRLDKMVVNTVSPTRVVKVRIARKEGIRVDFGSQGVRGLSADQLADEVSKAVSAALKGSEKGAEAARVAARKERGAEVDDSDETPRPRNPKTAERRRRARQAVEKVRVRAESAHGMTAAEWRGRCDVKVRIAPEALTRFDENTLCRALNETLEAVRKKHSNALVAIFKKVYEFDRFGENVKVKP